MSIAVTRLLQVAILVAAVLIAIAVVPSFSETPGQINKDLMGIKNDVNEKGVIHGLWDNFWEGKKLKISF